MNSYEDLLIGSRANNFLYFNCNTSIYLNLWYGKYICTYIENHSEQNAQYVQNLYKNFIVILDRLDLH